MSLHVVGIGTAVPEHTIAQSDAASVSRALLPPNASPRHGSLLEALYRRSGVERRGSVLLAETDGDCGARAETTTDSGAQGFYKPATSETDGGPGTASRMAHYERSAIALLDTAARRAILEAGVDAAAFTHLITVSCTGFYAPGLDAGLINRLSLPRDVARAHIGFMGCHGLFNAIGVAKSIVEAEPSATVLVAAVELCSLHFSYGWESEKIVANSLFADGAAALICTAAGSELPQSTPLLAFDATASYLLPDSEDAMTWRIGDHGFEMTLAASVPGLVARHVGPWLDAWLGEEGLCRDQVRTWAVHPGGPRILTAFERSASLRNGALAVSRLVLSRCGNMSSVTVAFILEELSRSGAESPGVAVGFGPGMVAEGLLFRTLDGGKHEDRRQAPSPGESDGPRTGPTLIPG